MISSKPGRGAQPRRGRQGVVLLHLRAFAFSCRPAAASERYYFELKLTSVVLKHVVLLAGTSVPLVEPEADVNVTLVRIKERA